MYGSRAISHYFPSTLVTMVPYPWRLSMDACWCGCGHCGENRGYDSAHCFYHEKDRCLWLEKKPWLVGTIFPIGSLPLRLKQRAHDKQREPECTTTYQWGRVTSSYRFALMSCVVVFGDLLLPWCNISVMNAGPEASNFAAESSKDFSHRHT